MSGFDPNAGNGGYQEPDQNFWAPPEDPPQPQAPAPDYGPPPEDPAGYGIPAADYGTYKAYQPPSPDYGITDSPGGQVYDPQPQYQEPDPQYSYPDQGNDPYAGDQQQWSPQAAPSWSSGFDEMAGNDPGQQQAYYDEFGGSNPGDRPQYNFTPAAVYQQEETTGWRNTDRAVDGSNFYGVDQTYIDPATGLDYHWDPTARAPSGAVQSYLGGFDQGASYFGEDNVAQGQQLATDLTGIRADPRELRNFQYTQLGQQVAGQNWQQAQGVVNNRSQAFGDLAAQTQARTQALQVQGQAGQAYSDQFHQQQADQNADYRAQYANGQMQADYGGDNQQAVAREVAANQFDQLYATMQQGYGFQQAAQQMGLSQGELLHLWTAGQANDPAKLAQIRAQWIDTHGGTGPKYSQDPAGEAFGAALGIQNAPIALADRALGVLPGMTPAGRAIQSVFTQVLGGPAPDLEGVHSPLMALIDGVGLAAHDLTSVAFGLDEAQKTGYLTYLDQAAASGAAPQEIVGYLVRRGEAYGQQSPELAWAAEQAANLILYHGVGEGLGAVRGGASAALDPRTGGDWTTGRLDEPVARGVQRPPASDPATGGPNAARPVDRVGGPDGPPRGGDLPGAPAGLPADGPVGVASPDAPGAVRGSVDFGPEVRARVQQGFQDYRDQPQPEYQPRVEPPRAVETPHGPERAPAPRVADPGPMTSPVERAPAGSVPNDRYVGNAAQDYPRRQTIYDDPAQFGQARQQVRADRAAVPELRGGPDDRQLAAPDPSRTRALADQSWDGGTRRPGGAPMNAPFEFAGDRNHSSAASDTLRERQVAGARRALRDDPTNPTALAILSDTNYRGTEIDPALGGNERPVQGVSSKVAWEPPADTRPAGAYTDPLRRSGEVNDKTGVGPGYKHEPDGRYQPDGPRGETVPERQTRLLGDQGFRYSGEQGQGAVRQAITLAEQKHAILKAELEPLVEKYRKAAERTGVNNGLDRQTGYPKYSAGRIAEINSRLKEIEGLQAKYQERLNGPKQGRTAAATKAYARQLGKLNEEKFSLIAEVSGRTEAKRGSPPVVGRSGEPLGSLHDRRKIYVDGAKELIDELNNSAADVNALHAALNGPVYESPGGARGGERTHGARRLESLPDVADEPVVGGRQSLPGEWNGDTPTALDHEPTKADLLQMQHELPPDALHTGDVLASGLGPDGKPLTDRNGPSKRLPAGPESALAELRAQDRGNALQDKNPARADFLAGNDPKIDPVRQAEIAMQHRIEDYGSPRARQADNLPETAQWRAGEEVKPRSLDNIRAQVEKLKGATTRAAKENALAGMAGLNTSALTVNDDDSDEVKHIKYAIAIIGTIGAGYALINRSGVTKRVAAKVGKNELPDLNIVQRVRMPADTQRLIAARATQGYLQTHLNPAFTELAAGKIGLGEVAQRATDLIDGKKNIAATTSGQALLERQVGNLWDRIGPEVKKQIPQAVSASMGDVGLFTQHMATIIDNELKPTVGKTPKLPAAVVGKQMLAEAMLQHSPGWLAEQVVDRYQHQALAGTLDQIGKEYRAGGAGKVYKAMGDGASGWLQSEYLANEKTLGSGFDKEPTVFGRDPVAKVIGERVGINELEGKRRIFASEAAGYLQTAMARELGTEQNAFSVLQFLGGDRPLAGEARGRLDFLPEKARRALDGVVDRNEFRQMLGREGVKGPEAKTALDIFDNHQADANRYGLAETRSHMRDYDFKTRADITLGAIYPFHYWTTHNLAFVAKFAAKHPLPAMGIAAAAIATMQANKDLPTYQKLSARVPARWLADRLPDDQKKGAHAALDEMFGKGQDPRLNLWDFANPFIRDIAQTIDRKDWHDFKGGLGNPQNITTMVNLVKGFGYHESPQIALLERMAQKTNNLPQWLDGLTKEPYPGRGSAGALGSLLRQVGELTPLAGAIHGYNQFTTDKDYTQADEDGLKAASGDTKGYWGRQIVQSGLYLLGAKPTGTSDEHGKDTRAKAGKESGAIPAAAIPQDGGGQLPENRRQQAFFAANGQPKGNKDDPNDPWKKSDEGKVYWDKYRRLVDGDESAQSPNTPSVSPDPFRGYAEAKLKKDWAKYPPTKDQPGYNAGYSASWYDARDKAYEAAGLPPPPSAFEKTDGPVRYGLAGAASDIGKITNGTINSMMAEWSKFPPKAGEPGYSASYSASWYAAREQAYKAAGIPVPGEPIPSNPARYGLAGAANSIGALTNKNSNKTGIDDQMSAIMSQYEALKDPKTGKGTAASSKFYTSPLGPGAPSPEQFVSRWSSGGATKGTGLEHPGTPARGYGVGYDKPGGAPSPAATVPSAAKPGTSSPGVSSSQTSRPGTTYSIPSRPTLAPRSSSPSLPTRPSTASASSPSRYAPTVASRPASAGASSAVRYSDGFRSPTGTTATKLGTTQTAPTEPGSSAKEIAAAYNAWQAAYDKDPEKAPFEQALAVIERHAASGGDPAPYVRRAKFTTYRAIKDFKAPTRQAGDKLRGDLFARVKALPDTLEGARKLAVIYRQVHPKKETKLAA